jgi:2-oxoglutarate dehydrogenase complex dehydrogenase (E1) component-like enzyme
VAQQQFEDLNSGFIQELFEQYLRAPESVDPAWRGRIERTPPKQE